MAYAKTNVEHVISDNPDITVLGLAKKAAEAHALQNGCTFEENSGAKAVELLGVSPGSRAADLSANDRNRLARILEELEIDCVHKGVETPAQKNMAALIELEALILRAAQHPGIECSVPFSDVCRIMTAIAGKSCYVSTG